MGIHAHVRPHQLVFSLAILGLTGQRGGLQKESGPALGMQAVERVKFTVANLGTDGRLGQLGDGLFAFEVRESWEGKDLNGDGDEADDFYRVHDMHRGTLTDLDVQLTVPEANDILVEGRFAAFSSFVDGELYAFDADAVRIVALPSRRPSRSPRERRGLRIHPRDPWRSQQ